MNNQSITKGTTRKSIASIIISSIIGIMVMGTLPTEACGCAVLVTGDESGWEYGEDSPEQAFINYQDGVEKLIIQLDVHQRDKGAVLITPVPAPAELVKADVFTQLPSFHGYDVLDRAQKNVSDLRKGLLATQIYPVVPYVIAILYEKYLADSFSHGGMIPRGFAINGTEEGYVVVHSHLEKNGMIMEVLSARTSDGMYTYLAQKGLNVSKDSISVLQSYIEKDNTFVVGWIDPAADNSTARGMFMSFPTKEIFYPLKPGAAYDGLGQPKDITIVGFVTPHLFKGIANAQIQYYHSAESMKVEGFFDSPRGFDYTTIHIAVPPANLTDDLTAKAVVPTKVTLATVVNAYPLSVGIVLFILLSLLVNLMVIFVALGLTRNRTRAVLWLTCVSVFTLLGTIIGAFTYRGLETRSDKWTYIICFSIFFCVLSVAVTTWLIAYLQ